MQANVRDTSAAVPGTAPAAVTTALSSILSRHFSADGDQFVLDTRRVAVPSGERKPAPTEFLVVRDVAARGQPILLLTAVAERSRVTDWLTVSAGLCCPTAHEICVIDITGQMARRWLRNTHPWDLRQVWTGHQANPKTQSDDGILAPGWGPPDTVARDAELRLDSVGFSIPLVRLLQIAVLAGHTA